MFTKYVTIASMTLQRFCLCHNNVNIVIEQFKIEQFFVFKTEIPLNCRKNIKICRSTRITKTDLRKSTRIASELLQEVRA